MSRLEEIKQRLGVCEVPECDLCWAVKKIEAAEKLAEALRRVELCSLYILESKNGRKIKDITAEALEAWEIGK